MKTFEVKITVGGAVGHVIVGGGALSAEIKDLSTAQTALYTIYMAGIGVGLPAFRATSRAFRFNEADHKTASSFAGYGYLGGISLEAGAGLKIGGGIKIPNGPLIATSYSGDYGGIDISVSHNVTRWAL
ncbi:hypothetical protein [Phytopseudomonas dryadis]|uniref:Uncharacterized protein n=1 Tax=Phytopseudomonas dryadis TaxID=2487520 RepID=A0A4Q9R3M2_9GAMM|nr:MULTISPECIES: hypothetical protein [Pseudomonas]TBU94520.1 hypothetical protein DNK44_09415 [Pseudomonas dryadis]TBU99415.1 hypothetical protein DNK34_24580 [Pseudomonas dryadis]TBV12256.1 hypothetical protein DNK41_24710 [Pseudomonas sp. FRB 230]